MNGVLPWLVRWACRAGTTNCERRFLSWLGCSRPSTKYFFPHCRIFQFICPRRPGSGHAVVLGHLSLSMCLWSCPSPLSCLVPLFFLPLLARFSICPYSTFYPVFACLDNGEYSFPLLSSHFVRCLSDCLSVCLSVYLFVCLPVCLSVCLSVSVSFLLTARCRVHWCSLLSVI
jgi:hypothetical protein